MTTPGPTIVPLQTVSLIAHPATPCPFVRHLEATAGTVDGQLRLSYRLTGDVQRLIIPPVSDPVRTEELWKHTCFEAFAMCTPGSAYYELNVSPSTAWALYRFSGYRAGMAPQEDAHAPLVRFATTTESLSLDASLDLASMRELLECDALRLAIAVVLEDTDRRLSYWALGHPSGKPDFHHPDGFALVLPAPDLRPRSP